MSKFNKSIILTSLLIALTGCGGSETGSSDTESSDAQSSPISNVSSNEPIPEVPSDSNNEYIYPSLNEISDFTNYRTVIGSSELASNIDTSAISIGVMDSGFRSDHVEFKEKYINSTNYDELSINNGIESGLYTTSFTSWEWADHGSGVSAIAAGNHSGVANSAELVASMSRYLIDSFDQQEYLDSLPVDENGFLPTGECVNRISPFPYCVDANLYEIKQIKDAATYSIPAINLSFTTPFNAFMTGFDLSYDRYLNDNTNWYQDALLASDDEFFDIPWFSYNQSYSYFKELLSDAETVIVNSAGNDAASLSQERVMPWQNLINTSTNPYKDQIVNIYFDQDNDENSNGVIEDNERGLTEGLLFVGALDSTGKLAWYSNYPGSIKEVQDRFITAPGETMVATPSLGVNGYEFGGGTSYAAPVISGAIGMLKAKHPNKTAREIANAILESANNVFEGYLPEKHGKGLIDVRAADYHLSN